MYATRILEVLKFLMNGSISEYMKETEVKVFAFLFNGVCQIRSRGVGVGDTEGAINIIPTIILRDS